MSPVAESGAEVAAAAAATALTVAGGAVVRASADFDDKSSLAEPLVSKILWRDIAGAYEAKQVWRGAAARRARADARTSAVRVVADARATSGCCRCSTRSALCRRSARQACSWAVGASPRRCCCTDPRAPARRARAQASGAQQHLLRRRVRTPPLRRSLAQATANETHRTFFAVRPSNTVSKWAGDSEKYIRSVFAAARSRRGDTGAIVFFDEIDWHAAAAAATHRLRTRPPGLLARAVVCPCAPCESRSAPHAAAAAASRPPATRATTPPRSGCWERCSSRCLRSRARISC